MRTTIDMPDPLFRRAKAVMAKRGITFRALVVDALDQALEKKPEKFVLRDASAGYVTKLGTAVTSREINDSIDDIREPKGHP